jgi:thiosulfate reductase cytochrome b subunit
MTEDLGNSMSQLQDSGLIAAAGRKEDHGSTGTIYRHTIATRVLHWVNAMCVFLVLMSGLQIFNAHPRLYSGQYGANADPAILDITQGDSSDGYARGVLRIGGHELPATRFLGLSEDKAFPGWLTIPSYRDLATGRRWHFLFAWLLVFNSGLYFSISFFRGHIKRDLLPTRAQLAPTRILREIWNHLKLRFPKGEAARHYNSLQKLAYLAILFLLAPMILATGLTMSPDIDAGYPWLVTLFGGRQSARTLHFICAMAVVTFIVIHLAMVVLAGPVNQIRSMITGRYVLPSSRMK